MFAVIASAGFRSEAISFACGDCFVRRAVLAMTTRLLVFHLLIC